MVNDYSDISLDDFISKNKIGKGGRGSGSGSRGRGNGRGRGDSDRFGRGGDRGAVNKRSNDNSGGQSGGFSRRNRNLPDKWDHDMYSGGRGGGGGSSSGGKLLVANLDFGVTDEDMRELFSEFGSLRKAQILYDRSGRSTGQAEIEFLRSSDARNAKEQYNQVPLDGRPMTITIPQQEREERRGGFRDRSRSPRRNRGGFGARDGGSRRGGRGGNRGGNRGGDRDGENGGGRRGKKEEITQEQLDAEMDAYLNDRKKE